MTKKVTTKRTTKKSTKTKDFHPNKMTFAVSAAAVSSLTLMAALMVQ